MATRLLLKKIITKNPQACSMNGVCASPGIATRSCFVSSGMVNRTPQDRGYVVNLLNNKLGAEQQRLLAAKGYGVDLLNNQPEAEQQDKDAYFQLWNNNPLAGKQRLLLPYFAAKKDSGYVELLVEQQVRLAELARKTTKDSELGINKLEVEQQQRLLQKEVKVQEWLKNFKGSLLSIQHHHESGGEEVLKFMITRPFQNPLSKFSLRSELPLLQRPGPYNLPRQAVEGVVCITTKDAFRLHNLTTGFSSPWIDTTAAREGRQVESISLGFDPKSKQHKVVCVSSYVTAPETTHMVVEVLNVHHGTWTKGQHKWRKLKDGDFSYGRRFTFQGCPLYLDGRIYWLSPHENSKHYILELNIRRETFTYIPVPVKFWEDIMDSSRQIRLMLMVVDGKVAVLKSTPDQKTSSLGICHRVGGDVEWAAVEWMLEEVWIPNAYSCPGSSIEALTGTDLIFTHSNGRTTYYNRKMEVSLTSPMFNHLKGERVIQL